jgi:hypothetical protein
MKRKRLKAQLDKTRDPKDREWLRHKLDRLIPWWLKHEPHKPA